MERIEIMPDKKTRWWGKERNERRRERYQSDVEYRRHARQQTRETYRRIKQALGVPVRSDDCAENLPKLPTIGKERLVKTSIGSQHMLTFTAAEMARALDRNPQVIYRWFAADLFPRPVVVTKNDRNRDQFVYTEWEAEAVINEFSRHQKESQYYKERHTETRDRIFAAVDEVRSSLTNGGILL